MLHLVNLQFYKAIGMPYFRQTVIKYFFYFQLVRRYQKMRTERCEKNYHFCV